MADVLEAAAAAIRNRQQVVSEALEAGVDMTSNAAVTTAEAVQQASRVLAEAASSLIPRSGMGAEEGKTGRGRGRSGRKAAAK